ncbi:hypothetical protein ACLGIH_15520 [Streptomyces sp. HMX87]|uniref:hypothetical protein n=1 Tax=Streptomyces sp. HMX87 TaxID=3390849 RepID=UPI003A88B429
MVLVVGSWSFTESINDGVEPTSGPRPVPSSSSPSGCSVSTPTPSADAERDIMAHADVEPGSVATAIVCKTSD